MFPACLDFPLRDISFFQAEKAVGYIDIQLLFYYNILWLRAASILPV